MKPLALIESWFKDANNHDYIGVIYLNVDNLQWHNDSWGHDVGDASLARITGTIHDIVTPHSDRYLRCGGNEFIVVLYDEQTKQTFEIADNLRQAIEALQIKLLHNIAVYQQYPNQIKQLNSDYLTVSVGAFIQNAKTFAPGSHPLDLPYNLCTKAKQAGKNQVTKLDMR